MKKKQSKKTGKPGRPAKAKVRAVSTGRLERAVETLAQVRAVQKHNAAEEEKCLRVINSALDVAKVGALVVGKRVVEREQVTTARYDIGELEHQFGVQYLSHFVKTTPYNRVKVRSI